MNTYIGFCGLMVVAGVGSARAEGMHRTEPATKKLDCSIYSDSERRSLCTDAAAGKPQAMVGMAVILIAHDNGQAGIPLLHKAASKGSMKAMEWLNSVYALGLGVEIDPVKSAYWARKAVEHGSIDRLVSLADYYLTGHGVPEDDKEGMDWLWKAVDQHDPMAEFELAKVYREGNTIVSKDDGEAAKWCKLAAEHGEKRAQLLLGAFYWAGRGVSKDRVLSYAWYNVASGEGDKDAVEAREAVEPVLTEQERSTGQTISRGIQSRIDQWLASRKRDDKKKGG